MKSALVWISLLALGASAAVAQPALRLQALTDTNAWTVSHAGQTVLRYVFAPRQFKAYVAELSAPGGRNLLRDSPADHLHHHGLMYAIRVNGLNFWEEISGSGVQKAVASPPPEFGISPGGLPQATVRQTLHWLAPQDAFLPDSPTLALLVEHRTLVLTVDAARGETALHWNAQFEVGGRTNTVVLTGSTYFGLGMRFLEELDPVAQHWNSDGKLDLAGTQQDVTPHDWGAVIFDRPVAPATLAVFGHPKNARGRATFFTMKRPFAYVAATQALHQEPLVYRAGDKFQVDYLVTVYSAVKSASFLNARAAAWQNSQP